MKRRTFFLTSLLIFMNKSVSGKSTSVDDRFATSDDFHELLSAHNSPHELARLGDQYLRLAPAFNDADVLFLNLGLDNPSSDKLRLYEQKRARDFQLGDTVSVDGWVLSKAEVSLCCAASMCLSARGYL